jgi:hypothetical protein
MTVLMNKTEGFLRIGSRRAIRIKRGSKQPFQDNKERVVAPKTSEYILNAGGIYRELASHQLNEDWHGREILGLLQEWADRFNVEFNLQVPQVALCVETLPAHIAGHFRYGHNGFGLRGEIALNSRYLRQPDYDVLGTLLHELIHGWQEAHGKPGRRNYHNRQYRTKARELGLLVDTRGRQTYAAESAFKDLLLQHEIDVPAIEQPATYKKPPSKSKLKKWSCGCTNVWCAIAEMRARCLKCGGYFDRQA